MIVYIQHTIVYIIVVWVLANSQECQKTTNFYLSPETRDTPPGPLGPSVVKCRHSSGKINSLTSPQVCNQKEIKSYHFQTYHIHLNIKKILGTTRNNGLTH